MSTQTELSERIQEILVCETACVDPDDAPNLSHAIVDQLPPVFRVAPELLEALIYLMEQTVESDMKYGIVPSEGEEDAYRKAQAVVAQTAEEPEEKIETRYKVWVEVEKITVTDGKDEYESNATEPLEVGVFDTLQEAEQVASKIHDEHWGKDDDDSN